MLIKVIPQMDQIFLEHVAEQQKQAQKRAEQKSDKGKPRRRRR